LAIALIREGKVVWTEGFEVANTLTRRPVSPDTVFEAACIAQVPEPAKGCCRQTHIFRQHMSVLPGT
jgi:hypothetical protein